MLPHKSANPWRGSSVLNNENRSEPSFAQIFRRNCVTAIPDSRDKGSILHHLLQHLVQTNRIDEILVSPLLNELLRQGLSTFTSEGIRFAFPELRSARLAKAIGAIGVSFSGVEFASPAKPTTKLVVVTLSPRDERVQHARILNRLFALTRQKSIPLLLNKHASLDEIYTHICELDGACLN